MKICNVCGNAVNDYETECPNCGSFSFKDELQEEKIKLRRFK